MSVTDELLRHNAAFAEKRSGQALPPAPARGVVVVCCMDARLHVPRLLGLGEGDAHVIRNAGGVVTGDVLRSITLSSWGLGTREVMVIGHTDCGLNGMDEDALWQRAEAESEGPVPRFPLHSYPHLEAHVADGVRRVREATWLPRDLTARGFVYDVGTGRLTEIGRS